MKRLNAYNTANDANVERMMGKAMCAYANLKAAKSERSHIRGDHSRSAYEKLYALEIREAECMSEYEATVRILDMFVKEGIYEIQQAVIDSCREEFGI